MKERAEKSSARALGFDGYGLRFGGQMNFSARTVLFASASAEKRKHRGSDLWFLKKRGGLTKLGLGSEDLAVESRVSLGPKKSLVVVRFLNRRLLLGVTDQRITTLTELATDDDDSDIPRPANGRDADFAAALRAADKDAPGGGN